MFAHYPMLRGADNEVVCLPVHDAIAVQQSYELMVVKAITTAWTEAVSCDAKPSKTDRAI